MHRQAPCQINPSQARRQEPDRSRPRSCPCRLFAERNASSPRSRTWEVAEHSREWQRLIHALEPPDHEPALSCCHLGAANAARSSGSMDEFLQAPPRLLIVAIENYDRHPKREGTTAAAPQELFAQTLV